MLDVRRLAVLAAAVREGSMAGAARALGITPSAASQAIGALEAQASTRLLHRGARGVSPTPQGERLAAHAEAVLAQLSAAEAELRRDEPSVLRLAAFPTSVAGLLPQVLLRLGQHEGAPAVTVVEAEPGPARTMLRAGEVDLALVNHHAVLAPDLGGPWQVEHLLDEPVLVALPTDHPLAGAAVVQVRDLAADDWVMQAPASPCQDLVHRVCAAEGFAPRVSATCGDYRSILRLVAVGHGVSLVPRLGIEGHSRGVCIAAPLLPVSRRVNALVPPDRAGRPAVRAVLATLREVAASVDAAAQHQPTSRSSVDDSGTSTGLVRFLDR